MGIMVMVAALVLGPGLAMADKLICISKEKLRGDETVNNCLTKGERFAIVDDKGEVRIPSQEEMALMKKINPKAFEQPAYGIVYLEEAPAMPPLPPLAVPKRYGQ